VYKIRKLKKWPGSTRAVEPQRERERERERERKKERESKELFNSNGAHSMH
jgi:hypothetical protein